MDDLIKELTDILAEKATSALYKQQKADGIYQQYYRQFWKTFNNIQGKLSKEDQTLMLLLEEDFNAMKALDLDHIYQKGLRDGIAIFRTLLY